MMMTTIAMTAMATTTTMTTSIQVCKFVGPALAEGVRQL